MSEMKGWIPIRPHLLRYVEWRECLVAGHPIVIPGMTIIAQALDLCLTNKTSYLTSTIRREESRVHEYSGRLHYLVSGITRCRYNFHFVTAQQGMAFNIFLHHAMHDDLLRLIQAGQAAGQYEINIIKNFLDQTGMDELINAKCERAVRCEKDVVLDNCKKTMASLEPAQLAMFTTVYNGAALHEVARCLSSGCEENEEEATTKCYEDVNERLLWTP